MIPNQRQLIQLFLPLALSGIFFPLARPIINATLARSENPEWALAAFGVALGLTMPIMAPLFGLRQVSTALATDKDMLARIRILTIALGCCATTLLLITCVPSIFHFIVIESMAIPKHIAAIAKPVLVVFALTPLLNVGRGYYQGILVHHKKAGPIGTGALIYVVGIVFSILAGTAFFSLQGALLAAIASLIGQALYLVTVAIPSRPIINAKMPDRSLQIADENRSLSYLFWFYAPLAISTILSALSEPALQTGMARSPEPTHSLAAYAIATSLGWLARTPLWNAQQVVISHATSQPSYAQTKKFMISLGIVSVCLTSLLSAPYLSELIFTDFMGVAGKTRTFAISGFRLMLPLIFLQALRSLYHGVLIRQGLTRHIQYAAMLKLPILFGAIWFGIWYGQIAGLYVAICSNLIAETAEICWLFKAQLAINWKDKQTP